MVLEQLPARIVCGDHFDRAETLPRERAVLRRYIQPSPPRLRVCLPLDLDHDQPEPWRAAGVPEPSVTIRNPATGHAHVAYLVRPAVAVRRCEARRAERFLAAVEGCYVERLGADRAYPGLWLQSPWSGAWDTQWGRAEPYTLRELAAFVPEVRRWRPPQVGVMAALGRNCDLFDAVRVWAYRAVLRVKRLGETRETWREEVLAQCLSYTALEHAPPLPYAECKYTSRSIADWTWRTFSEAKLSKRQAARGRRGGRQSRGGGRPALGEPWKAQGVSRRTWFRRQARERRTLANSARGRD